MWRSVRGTPWNRPAGNGDKIQPFVPRHRYSGITAAGSQYLPGQAHVDRSAAASRYPASTVSDGAWT